jgi:hypothetical protein
VRRPSKVRYSSRATESSGIESPTYVQSIRVGHDRSHSPLQYSDCSRKWSFTFAETIASRSHSTSSLILHVLRHDGMVLRQLDSRPANDVSYRMPWTLRCELDANMESWCGGAPLQFVNHGAGMLRCISTARTTQNCTYTSRQPRCDTVERKATFFDFVLRTDTCDTPGRASAIISSTLDWCL